MTADPLANSLTTWSKGKISLAQALVYADSYRKGTLRDGLIKDYFNSKNASVVCRIPTCTNLTTANYCTDCTNMIPSSAVVGVLKSLGEFLCGRLSV